MKVTCLVDNAVQTRSTLWGEHGLAFLIEAQGERVLFDTGASGTVLVHNLRELNIPPASIAALALSHSHYDHSGGLAAFLELRPGLPLYAHPDLLRERFSQDERGERMRAVGLKLAESTLRRLADLRLSAAPQEIAPGVWTSGEIVERPEPEGRSPHHFIRIERERGAETRFLQRGERDGQGWAPDPYRDDLALALDSPAGLVLVCGCCHAGLLNTLAHVRRTFGRDPVAVLGGTHLISADADHLRRLMKVVGAMHRSDDASPRQGAPALYLNHCTGLSAYLALALAFGERVHPCPAGTILEL